ncbi:hypothetical protein [Streptomyces qinzhouensis]|uniref:Uncharacterized protein n=1 Tax=Streptomyces qinzhouensis TaxID=2599401 RepID=A0A5B8JND7_9ACTN|nr:hypothetical protein [Streptomyces qinzhouensis]QDY79310.1 hypothetical protein FQU76_25415 [Streptomyces qinzhouensis]
MNRITAGPPDQEAVLLVALLAAGGFWGLAPAWVPRTGYVRDRDTLIRCRAGLVRILQGESISARRRYSRGR